MRATADNVDNTIIGAPLYPAQNLRSMLIDDVPNDAGDDDASVPLFKIRAATQEGRRASASILINRRYNWRGYAVNGVPRETPPDRITLVANDGAATIGTLTVGFGGDSLLTVEELFCEEVAQLRDEGRRICEFTKLATDAGLTSRRVLASLFHVAYIFAYRVMGFDSLVIEVNPRHVKYYERILGLKALGAPRMNCRVNAPAVLLWLDFAHTQRQILLFGGRPQMGSAERSLYPYAFSVEEEAGIVARLRNSACLGGSQ